MKDRDLAVGELTDAGETFIVMTAQHDEARANAVRMALFGECSIGEAAAAVGRSRSTVQHWVDAARRDMQLMLNRPGFSPSMFVVSEDAQVA